MSNITSNNVDNERKKSSRTLRSYVSADGRPSNGDRAELSHACTHTSSSKSHHNRQTLHTFDPLFHLFMTISNPTFQTNALNDRRTIRYLSRLIPVADGDSGVDMILNTTRLELERAQRNRRRAARLHTRILQNYAYPFRDLISDDENDDNDTQHALHPNEN
jgi:hypothetical protein